jgi:AcrR family transcriptional regulator
MHALEVGLRERKKAKQKIAIMEEFVSRLEQHELAAIRIEDLCSTLGISKVTFFAYFDTKEQVIEYFVHRWEFTMTAEIESTGALGRAALDRIFTSIGSHPAGQRVMNAVMLFFLKSEHYEPMHISEYEYSLFDPDAYARGIQPCTITGMLQKAVMEMHVAEADRRALVAALQAGFYGVPLTAKIRGTADLAGEYRRFLATLL